MSDENRDFIDLFDNDEENTVIEMPSEAANESDVTNDKDEKEKTLIEEICEPTGEQPENKGNASQNSELDFILNELNMLKMQNVLILGEIQKITDEKCVEKGKFVFEKYQKNLEEYQATFEAFKAQFPQIITQLRADLKTEYETVYDEGSKNLKEFLDDMHTGPKVEYKKIIEEAAANYGNLKKAIGNDINKAIETWNKVRGGEKERQKIERLLLIIAIMQAAITIRLLWNYFMGV